MVWVRIESEAGTTAALGRLFARYGCPVEERGPGDLSVAFPEAATEREALAEARLYLSMGPALRGTLRLGTA